MPFATFEPVAALCRLGGAAVATVTNGNMLTHNRLLRIALPTLLMLIWAGAASAGGNDPNAGAASASITGTINYRARVALPPDAVILLQLRDVSRMDVAAKLISAESIKPQDSTPIPFSLAYPPDQIDERMTYALFATIRGAGRLLLVTDRSYQVLTRGSPENIDLILVQP